MSVETGEVVLRKFQPESDDEQQMRELAFANAFFGRPFDDICRCKRWFGDVVINPYVKLQPENIHLAVIEETGRVVGYLTGSTGGEDFEHAQRRIVRQKVTGMVSASALPWNLFDQSYLSFMTHLVLNGEKERPEHPAGGAHWHFQVAEGFRGRGIGTRLFQRFIKDVRAEGQRLIWAEVMAYNEKPREYFEDRGWAVHDIRPTSLFGNKVDFPVFIMCIKKSLSAKKGPAIRSGRGSQLNQKHRRKHLGTAGGALERRQVRKRA